MPSQITSFPLTPSIITLTGADERTNLDDLVRLVGRNQNVEIGLLYSANTEGRNRYPSLEWLAQASAALSGRCAIHVCGREARNRLVAGTITDLTNNAARVQVNGRVEPGEVAAIAAKVTILLTQHTPANDGLKDLRIYNHHLLVDDSGGAGKSPGQWIHPDTHKQVGFAGGLGPDNLELELQKIMLVTRSAFWIDMESALRTNDWFDLNACEAVLNAAKDHARGRE